MLLKLRYLDKNIIILYDCTASLDLLEVKEREHGEK